MWTTLLPVEAFLFGCLSSCSFPLGALGGLLSSRYWSKELQTQSAALMIAFASGCLICAVTVELFASSVERTLEVIHAEHEAARKHHGAADVPRDEIPRDVVERSMGAESGHLEASETGETLKIQCILLIGSTLIGAILYIFLNRLMKNKLETRWDEPQEEIGVTPGTDFDNRMAARGGNGGPGGALANEFTLEYRRVYRRWRLKGYGAPSSRPSIPGSPDTDAPGSRKPQQTGSPIETRDRMAEIAGPPDDVTEEKSRRYLWVGLAIFLGQVIDGIPECILIGLMVMRKEVSLVLLAALFVTNLPEGFSSTQLVALQEKEDKKGKAKQKGGIGAMHLLVMWTALSLLTGAGAALVVVIFQANFPTLALTYWDELVCACVEGLAGGAMLAMIATVMLPASYNEEGDGIGIACVFGFCCAILIKLLGQIDDPGGVPLDIPNLTSDEKNLKPWGYQPNENDLPHNPRIDDENQLIQPHGFLSNSHHHHGGLHYHHHHDGDVHHVITTQPHRMAELLLHNATRLVTSHAVQALLHPH